jgi:flagellar hook assembly protein FlgD
VVLNYNFDGKEVKTLVNREMAARTHTVHWDGKDQAGDPAASGVYFYRLKTESFDQTRKMLLMK